MDFAILYAITYVASQLSYKWLPPPLLPGEHTLSSGHCALDRRFADLSDDDWRACIAREQATEPARLIWLNAFLTRFDRDFLANSAKAHFSALAKAGGRCLLLCDQEYPRALSFLRDPPLGLSCIGELSLLAQPSVAVIGSRQVSAFAWDQSFGLGRALAERGAVVVSGGAYGCDIAAHQGALAANTSPVRAICIFAGGLAELYPLGNRIIFNRLRDRRGLFLSERLWSAPCRPFDFPVRNRLIAGLSGITAVMQAGEKSGAMLTARLALDQGRDVAVLMHPDTDVRAQGNRQLAADGAWSFRSAEEFCAQLGSFD